LLRLLAGAVERAARSRRERIRRLPAARRPAVVIVGNLVVGGTGKTPVVAALTEAMAERGWAVGIVARGHRAKRAGPRLVGPDDDPREHGDEPVLLARATGRPVACATDRGQALDLLLRTHPDLTLVLADDGLQHLGLPRTVELAVFDERGAGNGRLLPAGPLREPLDHLATMDALLWRLAAAPGAGQAPRPWETRLPDPTAVPAHRYAFWLEPAGWRPVGDPRAPAIDMVAFAERMRGQRVHALAGIGRPERFFETLRRSGIEPASCHPLADHVVADAAMLPPPPAQVLMTAKDAVKFAPWADARCWFLEVRARIDPALPDWLEASLRGSSTH
jgi:tetraacyldisaccharide 4'-kinase